MILIIIIIIIFIIIIIIMKNINIRIIMLIMMINIFESRKVKSLRNRQMFENKSEKRGKGWVFRKSWRSEGKMRKMYGKKGRERGAVVWNEIFEIFLWKMQSNFKDTVLEVKKKIMLTKQFGRKYFPCPYKVWTNIVSNKEQKITAFRIFFYQINK